jgi:hypothetical protein
VGTALKINLSGDKNPIDAGREPVEQLDFPLKTGPMHALDPNRMPEFEYTEPGHHDFWFENTKNETVNLHLTFKSCNRCVTVSIGLAPPNWKQHQKDAASAAALLAGGGLPVGAANPTKDANMTPVPPNDQTWTELHSEAEKHGEAKPFAIPAGESGWVRISWKNEDIAPKMLSAKFATDTASLGSGLEITLQVPASFVEAVRVFPPSKEIKIEPLRAGDRSREVEFLVLSVTRDDFTLEADPPEKQQQEHPFVTCTPVRLNAEELAEMTKRFLSFVRSGYRVRVTVRERLDDGRWNSIGQFLTTFALKSDAATTGGRIELTVTGTVYGDVTVIAGDNEDRIKLGQFPTQRGITRSVTVESDAGTELTLDRKPDFMDVVFKKDGPAAGGRQSWRLTVTIKPNEVIGTFPRTEDERYKDTSIYLKTPTRPVRVIVTGMAQRE